MQYSLANLLSPEGEAILTDGSISVFDSYGYALRTFDILHFGGLIYLVPLIVIYIMMYHIPTAISGKCGSNLSINIGG